MRSTSIVIFISLILLVSATATEAHYHLRRVDLNHDRSSSSSGGSVANFILGPILFLFSFVLIWNNERKAAIDKRRLDLARTLVQEVNPFVQQQIYDANMKLTHITGKTQTFEPLVEEISGITMNNVVKIERNVEVREYREVGDENNRRRQLMWVNSHGESGYNNPSAWFIETGSTKARQANVGNYSLNQSQKDRLICNQQYRPTMQNAQWISQRAGRPVQPIIQGQYIYFPFFANDIDSHQTLRVNFRFCPVGNVSIIAQSHQNTFEPFQIDRYENNGENDASGTACDCCCCFMCACTSRILAPITQIDLIVQEMQSYQEMIDHEISGVNCRTNLIRILSYFLMVGGICLFFSPITHLLGYIPLVGGFLKSTVGIVIFIAALIVCLPLFLLALAISWVVFHPKVGFILLGVALLVAGIVIALSLANRPDSSTSQAAAKHLLAGW